MVLHGPIHPGMVLHVSIQPRMLLNLTIRLGTGAAISFLPIPVRRRIAFFPSTRWSCYEKIPPYMKRLIWRQSLLGNSIQVLKDHLLFPLRINDYRSALNVRTIGKFRENLVTGGEYQ